jgi:hypothetical protein
MATKTQAGKAGVTVSLIRIRNVLGIEELDIHPGALTVVEGKNGKGKTSVLAAIGSIVDGGHDATLLRQGATQGEVVLVLSDETEIRKRVTASGSTLTVRHPERGDLRSPKTFVDHLTDALAFNPVAFLAAPAAKQVEYLLDSLPMAVTAAEVAAALGAGVELERPISYDRHALQVLEAVHTQVYDERTGVNRMAREKASTAASVERSLPALGAGAEIIGLDTLRERKAALVNEAEAKVLAVQRRRDGDVAELKADVQRQIDALKQRYATDAGRLGAEAEAEVAEIRAAVAPESERLAAEISAGEARAEEAQRVAHARALYDESRAEAARFSARAEALTAALDRIEKLKASLLADLPITGLEVREGQVFYEGTPFRRVNTASRVQVAMMLAQMRAKAHDGLALVCVDGLELLDEETFEAFKRAAPKAGLQLIVTRVGTGELHVTEIPAEEVAA